MSILKFEKFVKSIKFAFFAWIVAICSISGVFIRAMLKVKSGHGLDCYISGKGYEFNYIGYLISSGAILTALLAGWIISRFQKNKKGKVHRPVGYKRFKKKRKYRN